MLTKEPVDAATATGAPTTAARGSATQISTQLHARIDELEKKLKAHDKSGKLS